MVTPLRTPAGSPARVRHLHPPRPIRFPVEEQVPEGKTHLVLRTFLFRLLRFAFGPEHSYGSDQFVYWNARDPKRCLSPDVFVRVGVADTAFDTWKTWRNGGVPELAVEIISPNEGDGVDWDEKLARYHELGVAELVRFDPKGRAGKRLRAWDRVDEDLVERVVDGERTPCLTLGVTWVLAPVEDQPVGLRLEGADGHLVESENEANARARVAAEARVRELEEQLRKGGG